MPLMIISQNALILLTLIYVTMHMIKIWFEFSLCKLKIKVPQIIDIVQIKGAICKKR